MHFVIDTPRLGTEQRRGCSLSSLFPCRIERNLVAMAHIFAIKPIGMELGCRTTNRSGSYGNKRQGGRRHVSENAVLTTCLFCIFFFAFKTFVQSYHVLRRVRQVNRKGVDAPHAQMRNDDNYITKVEFEDASHSRAIVAATCVISAVTFWASSSSAMDVCASACHEHSMQNEVFFPDIEFQKEQGGGEDASGHCHRN